jgi:hypothetical protein
LTRHAGDGLSWEGDEAGLAVQVYDPPVAVAGDDGGCCLAGGERNLQLHRDRDSFHGGDDSGLAATALANAAKLPATVFPTVRPTGLPKTSSKLIADIRKTD